ncbi:hypothetical protein TOT_030000213 [Theileria orientalis strain Shintoku]|uniref:Uncharacterized protein n=1 Tax=Theileria orientalis strain Shintoku TaxID=869250 RepID=J4CDD5_THEOR|nr:hypothetical protein TOT_030000213 [Theileria orientalis strain Shintoku]BAM40952.1 hypothetical protein TOT_030000213 [Theileria orientalis strain Shintoku]|eukprot:XP_009691253.1 hypothetical protein TOT_030000213 [Theileria orientalis strain Shintoku]
MSQYGVIAKGTVAFISLAILLCIVLPMLFLRRIKSNERKYFLSWVCMYISQMNPMISPMRIMHKQEGHTVEKVKQAVQQKVL